MKNTITTLLLVTAFFSQAQVGIGVAPENIEPSAQLEVKSTSKGFLPPRMLAAERDLISNLAAGLVLWCTDCGTKGEMQVYNGTEWTNMIGGTASAKPRVVGDSFGGGIIAYILQPTDSGFDSNVQHGLIAATSDQSSNAQWGCMSDVVGASGTAIGTGKSNTTIITTSCATSGIAAQIAMSYNGGGFTDWYLPSKEELNALYFNKTIIGGFSDVFYWSSSEGTSPQNDYYSWGQSFSSGHQQFYDNVYGVKGGEQSVRAVRSF